MRKLLLLCIALSATAVLAQDRPRPPQVSHEIAPELFDYQRRLDMLAKAIKRDAYIVAQMVHATGDLRDFQRNAAIEKAIDRLTSAQIRAREVPPASPEAQLALSKIDDALHHAREQASSADLPAVAQTILKESEDIQRDLFRNVETARRERELLVELQKKLSETNLDLEAAMIEALGSTMNFIRAGGK
jgi:hypothetical protein